MSDHLRIVTLRDQLEGIGSKEVGDVFSLKIIMTDSVAVSNIRDCQNLYEPLQQWIRKPQRGLRVALFHISASDLTVPCPFPRARGRWCLQRSPSDTRNSKRDRLATALSPPRPWTMLELLLPNFPGRICETLNRPKKSKTTEAPQWSFQSLLEDFVVVPYQGRAP